jgi:crotonobetainyl-CoA:carnitine CoA-transferase CaiB-like acyl-CoA transferase
MDNDMAKPLNNVKVVDFSQSIAGSYCTKLMAGFGAEVIKVESTVGPDKIRYQGPFIGGPSLESGIPFLWLNTGKMSVALDLESEGDRAHLLQLANSADVVVESFKPGVMTRLGFDYDRLKITNSSLVMTSITSFGQNGPYRNYEVDELQLYAISGGMYLTGNPDREPLGPGFPNCQYTAGYAAYIGTLVALLRAKDCGLGQHVDISTQECAIDNVEIAVINYLRKGVIAKRGKHPGVPWDLYDAKDGKAYITCAPFRHWKEVAKLFDEPRLLEDRLVDIRSRVSYREEAESLIKPWIKKQSREKIFDVAKEKCIAWGYLADFHEVLSSPHLNRRGFFVEIEHPVVGRHLYCGAPFRLTKTSWHQGRAPLHGEHTRKVLDELNNSKPTKKAITKRAKGTTKAALPLEGIRILDLTHSWAAPHATRILSDFGAEVIRIEYPNRLCMLRGGKLEGEMYNKHPMWFQVSRNKLSVTLDFKIEEELEYFRELVKISDVVVDNARAGVMKRLGLDYKSLQRIKSEIIAVSMPAYGGNGPYAENAAYGGVMEAMGGILNLTGYIAGDKPVRIKELDVMNGLVGAAATMTALLHRQQTGEGQWVDVSQFEGCIHASIGEQLLEASALGTQSQPRGNRHAFYAPQGCYPCRGEDKWLTVTIRSDSEWAMFCELIGQENWAEEAEFATAGLRRENHDQLDMLIKEETSSWDQLELMGLLQAEGLCAAAVLNVADLCNDPHLNERRYFVQAEDGSDGLFPGIPIRLSETPGSIRWPGPNLGAHNRKVICDLLGKESAKLIDETQLGTAYDP